MPPAHYKVAGDMVTKKKQEIYKADRKTIADDIISKCKREDYPAPSKYNKKYDLVHKRTGASHTEFSKPGDRVSFINDAEHKALTGPSYHSKNYDLVERRVSAPRYHAVGKQDEKGPAFLRGDLATKNIAPNTYNHLESFQKT